MGNLLAVTVSVTYLSVSVLEFVEDGYAVAVDAVLVVKAHLRCAIACSSVVANNSWIFTGFAIIQEVYSFEF